MGAFRIDSCTAITSRGRASGQRRLPRVTHAAWRSLRATCAHGRRQSGYDAEPGSTRVTDRPALLRFDDPPVPVARPVLLSRLRERTAASHARLDAGIGPLATLEDYGRYLHGMDGFLRAALPHCTAQRARLQARRALLHMDLSDWGFVPRGRSGADGAGAARVCAGFDYALGWQYVVAGSTLGTRHVLRTVSRHAYAALEQHRFLHAHAGSDDWTHFIAALRDAGADFESICTGAVDAFDAAHAAFRGAAGSPWQ